MKCPGCNNAIDYRYLSCCPQCGFESLPSATEMEKLPATRCVQEVTRARRFRRALVKSATVLTAAFTGLVTGAFLFYFIGVGYLILVPSNLTGGAACARGTAICGLAILSGSFLGTVGGSVFAVKNLIQRY